MTERMHISTRLRAHLPAVPVLLLLVAAAAALWPTWPALVGTWHFMHDYQHGDLLTAFVACWIFIRGPRLPLPGRDASPRAVIALLLAAAGWLVAYKAASDIGQQMMIPVVLWCAVWAGCGWRIAVKTAVPLACLYFAIPVWEVLVPGLERMSIVVSETLLGWAGVPVSIAANYVTIPEGTFQIVEGCAGKRYFIVTLMVATLFAATSGMRPRHGLLLIVVAAALALVMNWIRIFIVIYSGHLTNMTSYFVAHEHFSLGWVLFAILVAGICLLGRRLAPPSPADPTAPLPGEPAPLGKLLGRPAMGVTLLLLCVPVAGVLYARFGLETPAGASLKLNLPSHVPGWTGPLVADSLWSPQYLGASVVHRAAYRTGGRDVEIYTAEYQSARLGAKLISSANEVIPDTWSEIGPVSDGGSSSTLSAPRALRAAAPNGQQWVVAYLYQIGGLDTANPIVAELAYGTLSWKRPIPARVVAVASPCRASCDEAARAVANFWTAAGALLLM